MAVSGRKAADFRGSILMGSAEDFDHCCEPCLTEGQHIEAFRYCVDCHEYLCKNCVRYHQKTKVLIHHQLIENDQADKHTPPTGSSETCTQKCSTHRNEVIKFFCPKHEALGCTDCMTMGHRTCHLEYIPDKCKDLGKSPEYKGTMKTLDEKLNRLDDIVKKATAVDKEIDICHDKVIQEISQFRKEINDHLDTLQKKIEIDISKRRSEDKQKVQNVFVSCTKLSSEIKQLQTSLQSRYLAKEYGKLFIALKQAKPKLQSGDVEEAEINLEKTDTHYTFERNKDISSILSEQDIGYLSTIAKTPSTTRKALALKYLDDSDINVRTETDNSQCGITGCAVLSHEKVVLTDYLNFKIKVVDIQTKVVNCEMKLDERPRDVTVLSNDQIAVTVTDKNSILIMTISDQLKIIHSIDVEKPCFGILCHKDSLFVLCHLPDSILILDLQRKVERTILLPDLLHGNPSDMAFCRDQKLLFISDYFGSSIVSISLEGAVRAAFKDKELGRPRGVLVLDDGSVLVCSRDNNCIYKLSRDLRQKQKVVDNVKAPCCIGYNEKSNELFIGSLCCDTLKTFIVSQNC